MSSYRIATKISRQMLLARKCDALQIVPLTVAYAKRCFANTKPHSSAAAPRPITKRRNFSTLKLAAIGTAFGAVAGSIYSIFNNWKDSSAHMEHERIPPRILATLPDVKITKRFVNPRDNSGLEILLFQFQTCPFCCKVRAFLDYMGISYSVVEVDAVLRQDIKWSGVKKVPMVLIRQKDGRYVQMTDSSAIVSLLASYMNDKRVDIGELASFYPIMSYFDDNGKKRHDVMNKYFTMYQDNTPRNLTKEMEITERKWLTWADNHLVHLITPNCYQTLDEAFETFKWFSEEGEWHIHFPKWERNLMVYGGAIAMWIIAKILRRRHNFTEDVRAHIYEALNKWNHELKKYNTKFLGGKTPNMADLAVFGVLSSMEGCKAFKDCLANTKIGPWFYSVKAIVQDNRGELIRVRIEGQLPQQTKSIVA